MFTLYARAEDYKTKKALICAKHNGLEIALKDVTDSNKSAAPFGRVPVLETGRGSVFATNAIVRYIARTRRDLGLYGRNFLESGQVDSWIEFSSTTLEVPLCTLTYPLLGLFEAVPAATTQAKADVADSLQILEKHLLNNTFMVGHGLTAADISLVSCLADAFSLVFDAAYRSKYPNVERWFNLIINQPAVKHVIKNFNFCGGEAPSKVLGEKSGGKAGGKAQQDQAKDKNQKAKAKAKQAPVEKKEISPEEQKKIKLKKVIKEGGKRGVEIEGAADMGGLEFFCNSVDEPEGDLELLEESLKAMVAESKPDDEERKGGAGKVGKMVFSSSTERLAVICDVPANKRDKLKAKDWMSHVMKEIGGKVVKSEDGVATGSVAADPEKGRFPIKLKDDGINCSIAFLKSKGLFPDGDDDDDDDYVFGDEDFPA